MTLDTCNWPGRIPGDPQHDRIMAYLAIDIQKSPAWIDELAEKIHAVQTGKLASWERTGNAYYLHIFPQYVEIEVEYTGEPDETLKITLSTFAEAVKAWQNMLHHRNDKD